MMLMVNEILNIKLGFIITFSLILNIWFIFILHYQLQRNDYRRLNHIKVNTKRLKRDWQDYEAIREGLAREGPGEVGAPVSFDEYKSALYKEYGYDAVLSDQISVNRSVPDTRPEGCHKIEYLADLPKATVIIIFYNERLSVLLRTLHGVINRSPKELLLEIILVDDCSTYPDLHRPLTDYLQYHLRKVRLIRLTKRSGLMVARMTGARAASKESEVLIFMDAHFEVNYNWLPPLLEPIALNPKACTSPGLDHISFDRFKYEKNGPYRGFFDWKLNYYFFHLKQEEEKQPHKNIKEYIIMGAAIAIGTDFFWDLGGFDEGMELWGGEQFELSFKVWMCGGENIQVPCSRMAHLFRDPDTKGNTNLYGGYQFVSKNYRRFVDVWMDEEHRQIVFNRRDDIKNVDPGDLTDRIAIRERLKCKSFSWMMENIMTDIKEIYPPIEPEDLGAGLFRSLYDPTLCVALGKEREVVLKSCPTDDSSDKNMNWVYNFRGEFHNKIPKCLESDVYQSRVSSWSCHKMEGNQKWYYDIKHQWVAQVQHKTCMVADVKNRLVKLAKCDSNEPNMKWNFTRLNREEMEKWDHKLNWNSKPRNY